MVYDWQAALITLLGLIALTKLVKFFLFKIPALRAELDKNKELWRERRKLEKYPPVMKGTQTSGLAANVLFFVAICPWFVTLEPQSIGTIALHVFVILMVYDFFYYLTHRFLFHGQGVWRKIHAVHHQARDPSFIDAHYVDWRETIMGMALFTGTIPLIGFFVGPFNVITLILTYFIFTQLNILNHCKVQIPFSPWKTASWITERHGAHHENMHKGNYATITLLYDKLFGTYC
jgi:sterol desaturase/sphingolipid hydroxylase (fatty acid hydroxylase superfamily)